MIAGLGLLGAAAGLAACGGEASQATPGPSGTTGSQSAPAATNPTAESIRTDSIPVGGGVVFASRDTVVTQPTEGQFKAFSALCTHQGCFVTTVSSGTINCECHGSKFSIVDGSVTVPAPGLTAQTQPPLPAKAIGVSGGEITIS